MADPVTIAAIGGIVSAAGSVFTGVSGYFAGKDQKKSFRMQGKEALRVAQLKSNRTQQRARRVAASQRARGGAQGVDQSGSLLDLQMDTAFQANAESTEIIRNGLFTKAGMKTKGDFAYMSGRNKLISGIFDAGGAILGGFSKGAGGGGMNAGDAGSGYNISTGPVPSNNGLQYPTWGNA